MRLKRTLSLCPWASEICVCWHRAIFHTLYPGTFDNLSIVGERASIPVPRKREVELPAVFWGTSQVSRDKIVHLGASVI